MSFQAFALASADVNNLYRGEIVAKATEAERRTLIVARLAERQARRLGLPLDKPDTSAKVAEAWGKLPANQSAFLAARLEAITKALVAVKAPAPKKAA